MMKDKIKQITSAESFTEELKKVQKKIGKEKLSDNELFILTCDKILRSYTFEEKGYK